jgi:hypothetical protein
MIVVQAKGKEHCRKMRQDAWELWRVAPATFGKDFRYYPIISKVH